MGHAIELLEEEYTLLSSIQLDKSKLDHVRYQRQGPPALPLVRSLIKRGFVRSLKRKCIVSVSHRCVLESDDNLVFGGIVGGIFKKNYGS